MTQLLVFQRQCLYISSQKRQYMGKYAGLVAAFHINDILFGLSTHINEAIHIVQHHHHLNKKKQFFLHTGRINRLCMESNTQK